MDRAIGPMLTVNIFADPTTTHRPSSANNTPSNPQRAEFGGLRGLMVRKNKNEDEVKPKDAMAAARAWKLPGRTLINTKTKNKIILSDLKKSTAISPLRATRRVVQWVRSPPRNHKAAYSNPTAGKTSFDL